MAGHSGSLAIINCYDAEKLLFSTLPLIIKVPQGLASKENGREPSRFKAHPETTEI